MKLTRLGRPRALVCAAICLLAGAIAPTVSSRASVRAYPRCFGAASRDSGHRCENPRLRLLVRPTPSEALILPDAPCAPIEARVTACSFGDPPSSAAGSLALVGDSHAAHWRAAVEVVAQDLHWSAVSLTRSGCPLTEGVQAAPEPKRSECVAWDRGVIAWLGEHPEVSTVVMSDHPGRVKGLPGQSEMEAWVAGITAAWAALPASVEHVIVIRDDPFIEQATLPCVEGALAAHRDAGTVCEFARGRALHHDPDVVAAEQLGSPRVQVVDMTHFFCGRRWCYPVVGGALVYKDDFDHLTSVFSRTLGPFLAAMIKDLMLTWHWSSAPRGAAEPG